MLARDSLAAVDGLKVLLLALHEHLWGLRVWPAVKLEIFLPSLCAVLPDGRSSVRSRKRSGAQQSDAQGNERAKVSKGGAEILKSTTETKEATWMHARTLARRHAPGKHPV